MERRQRRGGNEPEELILPQAPPKKPLAKPSVVPGRVKLTFVLELKRELAERLSVRAIREEKSLEAVVMELLEASAERRRPMMTEIPPKEPSDEQVAGPAPKKKRKN